MPLDCGREPEYWKRSPGENMQTAPGPQPSMLWATAYLLTTAPQRCPLLFCSWENQSMHMIFKHLGCNFRFWTEQSSCKHHHRYHISEARCFTVWAQNHRFHLLCSLELLIWSGGLPNVKQRASLCFEMQSQKKGTNNWLGWFGPYVPEGCCKKTSEEGKIVDSFDFSL